MRDSKIDHTEFCENLNLEWEDVAERFSKIPFTQEEHDRFFRLFECDPAEFRTLITDRDIEIFQEFTNVAHNEIWKRTIERIATERAIKKAESN